MVMPVPVPLAPVPLVPVPAGGANRLRAELGLRHDLSLLATSGTSR